MDSHSFVYFAHVENIFNNYKHLTNAVKLLYNVKKKEISVMRKSAFTLAEVLITLGIIGVVAAMTIPTLMNSTNSKETVTSLKKVFSTLSNAYTLTENEEGTPDTWGLSGDGGIILTKMSPS